MVKCQMEPLIIEVNIEKLEVVRDYVQQATRRAGVTGKPAYRLRLAVDEVLSNIITYGYQANGLSGRLRISAENKAGALCITVEDTAPPFDPLSKPCPDLSLPFEQRPEGQVGLYLARNGVDKLTYQRVGNCNLTVFQVHSGIEQPDW